MRPPSATGCSSSRSRGRPWSISPTGRRETALVGGSARCRLHRDRRPRGARPAGRRELSALDRARAAARDDARRDQALAQTASPAPAARSAPAITAIVIVQLRPGAAGCTATEHASAARRCDSGRRSSTIRPGRGCRGSARPARSRATVRTNVVARASAARPESPARRAGGAGAAARPTRRSARVPGTVRRPVTVRGHATAADRAADAQRHRDLHARRARGARQGHGALRDGAARERPHAGARSDSRERCRVGVRRVRGDGDACRVDERRRTAVHLDAQRQQRSLPGPDRAARAPSACGDPG